jgi:peptide/nickel transport system permease protein
MLHNPSAAHPLGTDDLGQDLLARMLYGGRISLTVGLAAMAVSVSVGTIVGAVAGVSRGSIDAGLVWLIDLFLSLPQIPVLLVIIYLYRNALTHILGQELGIFILIVCGIGAFRWMTVARLVRAQIFALREKEFVEAAVAQGAGSVRIMFSELLPNLWSTIIVFSTLNVANNLLLESALSFLGVGVQPPNASWGTMIATGQDLITSAPLLTIIPGTMILLTVLSLNVFGDCLRDALDPRSRIGLEAHAGMYEPEAEPEAA